MIDFSQKKFGLISLGCDKNRVDSEKLLSIIKDKGGIITSDIGQAQILIVNTCAFLNESRKEAIYTAIDCAAYKSDKLEKLVITGCLPQKYIYETFEALTEADVFLGTNDYDKFFEALEKSYEGNRINYVGRGNGTYCEKRLLTTPQHYAYLKIADGCNNHCTYCLIPKIRGEYVSYPMETLISEAKNLGDVSELILVAQDVTRYGMDLYGQKKLKELLVRLSQLDNINSIRLLYCYPEMIDDDLITEIRDNDKIIKYLDIPLQHSEDRVLKLMGRKGSRKSYLDLIKKLRDNIPNIALRSTFIAGFPSETEEECDALCSFLREAKFENCGFFEYSKEPDTAAYKLKNQIPRTVKKHRVKKLYATQQQISFEKLRSLVGKKLRVLCDGINYEGNCFEGRAYFNAPDIDGKVYFNAQNAVQGEYYEVIITDNNSYDLIGKTEDYYG